MTEKCEKMVAPWSPVISMGGHRLMAGNTKKGYRNPKKVLRSHKNVTQMLSSKRA